VLPAAIDGTGDARLTCGGETFPAGALDAPSGAESAVGPEFDALRATIKKFGEAFPEAELLTWRLAGRDDSGATFLAQPEPNGETEWLSITVTNTAGRWEPSGIGGCTLMVVLSPEFGTATWALNPASAAPTAASTELNILVWERTCSGGSPTSGRMSAPVVDYGADSVIVTIGVRPLEGMQTCPGPPGTPALLRLAEPLGDRTLLDGAYVPPAPPTPAF
jgi:hypothetical protein